MKKLASLLPSSCFAAVIHSRQVVNLENGDSYAYNGLEYGYRISNEISKIIL